ncbi:MAG: response regulator [Clostridiales bacterium]|nr:response regulator [Clostridiales bacterium]
MNRMKSPFPKRKENENARLSLRPALLAAAVLTSVLLLFAVGVSAWTSYSTSLMSSQTNQLQLVAQSLGQSIELSMQEYMDTLQFLCQVESAVDENDPLFQDFLLTQESSIYDLLWEDEDGVLLKSVNGSSLTADVLLTQAEEDVSIWQYNDTDGTHYLCIKQKLDTGGYLCLVINEENFYSELISDIHVGTNGYIVVKSSENTVIMHPSREQWGINVIEGRMELYPNLDFSSLSEMVQKQVEEEVGIYEYYSYWWTDPDLPRVKKISAHVHASIGGDFWIISAVVDYSDFYDPIVSGFARISLIFCCILVAVLAVTLYIYRLKRSNLRNSAEIQYLKELNETLEELHRREETLAHQQRLQVIGTLTGGIAHEFNNFLTPITGYADLIMASVEPDSELYENANEIYEAADRARDVIRQISSMSRKNVETVYKSIVAASFLNRAVRMIDAVRPANVQWKSEIDLKDEKILGNATQLHQVLLNICINAFHAMGKTPGVLTLRAACVERSEPAHRLYGEQVSDEWEHFLHIALSDTGCGMEPDVLAHIFEPFFTTKQNGQGTGLGLSLADQIIRTHRGYLCAESTPGEGTTFHIYLPVQEPESANQPIEWGQQHKLRFLIADDNQKVLKMLQKELKKLGLEPVICTRKAELVEQLEQVAYDVLAIDETLEDGDGISFCMSIHGKYPYLKKIIMTAAVTRDILEARQRQIIDNYVMKPVSDTTLLDAIRKCTEPSDHDGGENGT